MEPRDFLWALRSMMREKSAWKIPNTPEMLLGSMQAYVHYRAMLPVLAKLRIFKFKKSEPRLFHGVYRVYGDTWQQYMFVVP